MRQEDIELYNQIEILIKQIKELFIQIRIKSDRLWVLFDIRNFLICVKEIISLKQLPLVFRCYNSDYLNEITKLNEIDISTMKRKKIQNNKSNFFHIPSNLLLYIRTLNGIENGNIEEKFKKYLDPNFKIFESPEDFIKIYRATEKKILDYLKNYLFDKNIDEKIKYGLLSTIKDIENEKNIFQKNFDDAKNSCIELKKNREKRKNIICLLNVYERAINNFLDEYNEKMIMFKKTETFYMIRKEKVNEKTKHLAEEKKFVDSKIKTMKINKYNRKFLKYRFIQRNNFSNASLINIFLKGKSFEIKKNNKKDDSENYMLKY